MFHSLGGGTGWTGGGVSPPPWLQTSGAGICPLAPPPQVLGGMPLDPLRAVKIACLRGLCQPCGQLNTNIRAYTRTSFEILILVLLSFHDE